MSFELNPLPYDEDALEPVISRRTVSIHYGKHHAGYVKKLNDRLGADHDPGKQPLTRVIDEAHSANDQGLYNLAAQIWNHDFYWRSMQPDARQPGSALVEALDAGFGSRGAFEEQFRTAALEEFGSGWTWLCWNIRSEGLEILSTTDAVIPAADTHRPLLTLDVWEHAYYLDYQNERATYIERFLDRLVDWESAGDRLEEARAGSAQATERRPASGRR